MSRQFLTGLLIIFSSAICSAQDLIVTNIGDSLACKILSLSADSLVEYKYLGQEDPYAGVLLRKYYTSIIPDYFTDMRRAINPISSLGWMEFSFTPLHTSSKQVFLETLYKSNKLFDGLSKGTGFSLGYHSFINGNINRLKKSGRTGLAIGFTLSHYRSVFNGVFIKGVDYDKSFFFPRSIIIRDTNVDTHIRKSSINIAPTFSYTLGKKLPTMVSISPGLQFLKYKNDFDNNVYYLSALNTFTGLSIKQSILNQNGFVIQIGFGLDKYSGKTGEIKGGEQTSSLSIAYDEGINYTSKNLTTTINYFF